MTGSPIRVSVLINSDIFTRGLEQTLGDINQEDVTFMTQTAEEVAASVAKGDIDILVLDTDLVPKIVPFLSESRDPPRTILVSEREHAGLTLPLDDREACGFFPARAPEARFRHYLQQMIACRRKSRGRGKCADCPVHRSLQPKELFLTRRESQIFRELGFLRSNREIAERLHVSPKTVEAHCANIKQKLGLDNSRELLQAAIEWVEGR